MEPSDSCRRRHPSTSSDGSIVAAPTKTARNLASSKFRPTAPAPDAPRPSALGPPPPSAPRRTAPRAAFQHPALKHSASASCSTADNRSTSYTAARPSVACSTDAAQASEPSFAADASTSASRSTAATHAPVSCSNTASTSLSADPANTNEDDDGFRPVLSRKAKARAHAHRQPADPAPGLAAATRLSASQGNSQPLGTPASAPRPKPAVGVSRPPPTVSKFPAFRVPHQGAFPTSYDAVAALEQKHPALQMRNVPGRDGSSVLLPLSQETYEVLHVLASEEGAFLEISEIDPSVQLSKGVVMGFPRRMPVALLQRHPQVEEAERCLTSRQREETRQVLISVRGPLPPMLDLGNWGVYYIRPWVPEPLRCFRCQKFGHHRTDCSRPPKCGVCSGNHMTEECLQKLKAKQEVAAKCPNCSGRHHAWSPLCPSRQQRVQQGKEFQCRWVQDKQAAAPTPAPPGTFVWGSQRRQPLPPPPPLTAGDFPPLQHSSVPMTAPRPPLPTTAALTTPPPPSVQTPPALPAGVIVLTREALQTFATELSLAVAKIVTQATGVTLDLTALERPLSAVTGALVEQMATKIEELANPDTPAPAQQPRLAQLTTSQVPQMPTTAEVTVMNSSTLPHNPPAPAPSDSSSGTAEVSSLTGPH